MDSLRNFFHRIGVGWTLFLVNNVTVTFSIDDKGPETWLNGDYILTQAEISAYSQIFRTKMEFGPSWTRETSPNVQAQSPG
jgi:hypothetical protein